MKYLGCLVIAIVSVELVLRLNFFNPVGDLYKCLTKIKLVLFSKNISDHWKEKVLLNYSGQLAMVCLKIGGALLVLVAIIFGGPYILGLKFEALSQVAKFTTSVRGIISMTVLVFVYVFIRRWLHER